MKTIAPLLVVAVLSFSTLTFSQELESPKLKSMTTAKILAFDPIPGDALFYAGKPFLGVVDAFVGGLGASMMLAGILVETGPAVLVIRPDGTHDDAFEKSWGTFALGTMIYLPALALDAVEGIRGVRAHNDSVIKAKQESRIPNWTPIVSVDPKGGVTGAIQVRF